MASDTHRAAPAQAGNRHTTTRTRGRPRLVSADGRLSFAVHRANAAICVERTERQPHQRQVTFMLFDDAPRYALWCDTSAVRLEDPGLCSRLRRHADADL